MPRYTNPILPGFHPDPSICRAGEDYYLVTSSFEYFPGVPLFHSRDLVHWRQLGHVLNRDSQLPLDNAWTSGGIYAPTIRHHAGRWYMTTTNINHRGNFYVWTDDIASGQWSEPIWVDQEGIDPSLFFDDDGTVYFTSSGRSHGVCRIVQSTLDIATGQRTSEVRTVWHGTGGKGPEGPHLYKRDRRYYLMIAEGGTEAGHMVTICRSDSPWGPWEHCPRNPILTHRSSELPIQNTGHADLVETPDGATFLVCLGVRPHGYHEVHNLGRETFLAPVTWDAAGWPVVGDPAAPGTLQLEGTCDRLPAAGSVPAGRVGDDFAASAWPAEWTWLRNPRRECYRRGLPGLELHGGAQNLDNFFWPTWLGWRQTALRQTATARIDFASGQDGDEAGLCIFQNPAHHYDIGIVCHFEGRRLRVRRRIGRLVAVTAETRVPDGPLTLRIVCDGDFYRFQWSADGQAFHELDIGESRYLSTEVGGRFTGCFWALYATGHGRACGSPARVSAFVLG